MTLGTLARRLVVTLLLAAPTVLAGQNSTPALPSCAALTRDASWPRDSIPNLQGIWDFKVDMGNAVSTGMMALGPLDDGYGGALTPDRTNTVVIRKLTLVGDSVHMSVASREGDVLFYGWLGGRGDTMCGTVIYHQGAKFQLTATQRKRP